MKLKVLGSRSSGNCYILENNTEALVIEAGVSFTDVKKALNFNIRKIVGVLISHCHSDHAAHEREYLKAGIPTLEPYLQSADLKYTTTLGKFIVSVFPLVHDVPCYGFLIQHEDIGNMIYVSDTEYVKYRFKDIGHMLLEANYDNSLVSDMSANRDHIFKGHMNIETSVGFIKANDNPLLQNIVLIHLSDVNSDEQRFKEMASRAAKYMPNVYVADKGLEINLNKRSS